MWAKSRVSEFVAAKWCQVVCFARRDWRFLLFFFFRCKSCTHQKFNIDTKHGHVWSQRYIYHRPIILGIQPPGIQESWAWNAATQPEVWQIFSPPLNSHQKVKQWQELRSSHFFQGSFSLEKTSKAHRSGDGNIDHCPWNEASECFSLEKARKSTIWRMLFSIENGHVPVRHVSFQGFFAPENGWLEDDASPFGANDFIFKGFGC